MEKEKETFLKMIYIIERRGAKKGDQTELFVCDAKNGDVMDKISEFLGIDRSELKVQIQTNITTGVTSPSYFGVIAIKFGGDYIDVDVDGFCRSTLHMCNIPLGTQPDDLERVIR